MSNNYACQHRPQKTRHLNALNLPQSLEPQKPHTLLPLNPRPAPRAGRRPLLLWSFDVRSCPIKAWPVGEYQSRGTVEAVSVQRMRAGTRGKKWGTGRASSAGQVLSEKVGEERPTATSGSIMEIHWRNSCLRDSLHEDVYSAKRNV